jgi:hypothetical protein
MDKRFQVKVVAVFGAGSAGATATRPAGEGYVGNARDCLEHVNKGLSTFDFELQTDGTIAPRVRSAGDMMPELMTREDGRISRFLKNAIPLAPGEPNSRPEL